MCAQCHKTEWVPRSYISPGTKFQHNTHPSETALSYDVIELLNINDYLVTH